MFDLRRRITSNGPGRKFKPNPQFTTRNQKSCHQRYSDTQPSEVNHFVVEEIVLLSVHGVAPTTRAWGRRHVNSCRSRQKHLETKTHVRAIQGGTAKTKIKIRWITSVQLRCLGWKVGKANRPVGINQTAKHCPLAKRWIAANHVHFQLCVQVVCISNCLQKIEGLPPGA